MNWTVYFIGGSRDLQKHAWDGEPRKTFECAVLERIKFPKPDEREMDVPNYKREIYSFRALRNGLGIYLHEETT